MTQPHEPNSGLSPTRILLIDDEPQIRKFIDISLRSQGYETLLAETGQDGLTLLASKGADLIILDLGLPDMDGLAVLNTLRLWSQAPVIILTARSSEDQKVSLLDAGANDYVTKPFGVEELMARIRAFLRTTGGHGDDSTAYDDGHLRIDWAQRIVLLDQQSLTLTRKEFGLLSMLARHPGRLITQTQVLRELWGPTHAQDTHYLRILVSKLRHKLGDSALAPRYIVTEPGVGLRFINHEE